jgi:hypothetical protein
VRFAHARKRGTGTSTSSSQGQARLVLRQQALPETRTAGLRAMEGLGEA